MNTGNWKTPLGYFEKALEELRRTQEEFQQQWDKCLRVSTAARLKS